MRGDLDFDGNCQLPSASPDLERGASLVKGVKAEVLVGVVPVGVIAVGVAGWEDIAIGVVDKGDIAVVIGEGGMYAIVAVEFSGISTCEFRIWATPNQINII